MSLIAGARICDGTRGPALRMRVTDPEGSPVNDPEGSPVNDPEGSPVNGSPSRTLTIRPRDIQS
jgi:hypothetical protein